jgi:hypothetical protein
MGSWVERFWRDTHPEGFDKCVFVGRMSVAQADGKYREGSPALFVCIIVIRGYVGLVRATSLLRAFTFEILIFITAGIMDSNVCCWRRIARARERGSMVNLCRNGKIIIILTRCYDIIILNSACSRMRL